MNKYHDKKYNTIDIWTLHHFTAGLVSSVCIFPDNIELSFVVSNLTHLFTESMEHETCTWDGSTVNSFGNHLADIIVFLFGWILGRIYLKRDTFMKIFSISVLLIFIISEVDDYLKGGCCIDSIDL